MKVHIDDRRTFASGMVDIYFYEEGIAGQLFYRLEGDQWISEAVGDGAMLPHPSLTLPGRWLDDLVEALNERRLGGKRVDRALIDTLTREQGRVDLLINHLTTITKQGEP